MKLLTTAYIVQSRLLFAKILVTDNIANNFIATLVYIDTGLVQAQHFASDKKGEVIATALAWLQDNIDRDARIPNSTLASGN